MIIVCTVMFCANKNISLRGDVIKKLDANHGLNTYEVHTTSGLPESNLHCPGQRKNDRLFGSILAYITGTKKHPVHLMITLNSLRNDVSIIQSS